MAAIGRRCFLQGLVGMGSAAMFGNRCATAAAFNVLAQQAPHRDPSSGGTALEVLPFLGEGPAAANRPHGRGLGGRRAFDLASLSAERLMVPNEEFFIRTRRPKGLHGDRPWTVRIDGLVRASRELRAEEIEAAAEPVGVHLLECSGNSAYRRFGLLSAARWSGVPLTRILAQTEVLSNATRVIVTGYDGHSGSGSGSVPGAGWAFSFADLEESNAFLTTRMNGERLSEDHGLPVRLVVPGWYGCACIKWVNRLELVDDSAPATSQMREFASRTHQDGVPTLARDYHPATIDLAAMPIRVEKRLHEGQVRYRVVGILWGGDRLIDSLEIRFNPDQPFVPVQGFQHRSVTTWNLWSHSWRPETAGRKRIQLRVADPKVRTRRLDSGYYTRTVDLRGV